MVFLPFFVSGTIQTQKGGTDVLLDLLSIGSPPQNGSSAPEVLSISQDNKNSSSLLDTISSTSAPAVQSSPTSMMDLLDGFGPSPAPPSKYLRSFYSIS